MKDQIFHLVQSGLIKKAITLGLRSSKELDAATHNEWLVLNTRFDKLSRDERIGVLSYSEASQERNRITFAILEMAKGVEDDDFPRGTPPKQATAQTQEERILFLASNPSNTGKLALEVEFARLSYNLQGGKFPFKLLSQWAVTPDSLQRAILEAKPRIIHFSGHGSTTTVSEFEKGTRSIASRSKESIGGLILQNSQGQSQYVDGSHLKELFGIFAKVFPLEVVILNACYSEPQAKAINEYIPYVIGMSSAIRDEAAIQFSSSFYRTLSLENNVELAFDLACNQVKLSGGLDGEVPVLHKKTLH